MATICFRDHRHFPAIDSRHTPARLRQPARAVGVSRPVPAEGHRPAGLRSSCCCSRRAPEAAARWKRRCCCTRTVPGAADCRRGATRRLLRTHRRCPGRSKSHPLPEMALRRGGIAALRGVPRSLSTDPARPMDACWSRRRRVSWPGWHQVPRWVNWVAVPAARPVCCSAGRPRSLPMCRSTSARTRSPVRRRRSGATTSVFGWSRWCAQFRAADRVAPRPGSNGRCYAFFRARRSATCTRRRWQVLWPIFAGRAQLRRATAAGVSDLDGAGGR